MYALVITRFLPQYDQYFPSFLYFVNLFHEPFASEITVAGAREILAILHEVSVRSLAYS